MKYKPFEPSDKFIQESKRRNSYPQLDITKISEQQNRIGSFEPMKPLTPESSKLLLKEQKKRSLSVPMDMRSEFQKLEFKKSALSKNVISKDLMLVKKCMDIQEGKKITEEISKQENCLNIPKETIKCNKNILNECDKVNVNLYENNKVKDNILKIPGMVDQEEYEYKNEFAKTSPSQLICLSKDVKNEIHKKVTPTNVSKSLELIKKKGWIYENVRNLVQNKPNKVVLSPIRYVFDGLKQ